MLSLFSKNLEETYENYKECKTLVELKELFDYAEAQSFWYGDNKSHFILIFGSVVVDYVSCFIVEFSFLSTKRKTVDISIEIDTCEPIVDWTLFFYLVDKFGYDFIDQLKHVRKLSELKEAYDYARLAFV